MAFQQCMIVGNVGRDAELSYTPQGIAVAKFTVAVNKSQDVAKPNKKKRYGFA